MVKRKENKKRQYIDSNKKEFIDNFWLNLGDVTKISTTNIIANHKLFKDNPALAIIDLMRRPENFSFTCSTLFNFHLHPYQANILKTLWLHPFSILTASRGAAKSTLLAVYAFLRAIFIPGSKIMFIGNAFRQSKIIFNYCEAIWRDAPMLRDIFGRNKDNRITHDNDMYRFQLENSTITALPLGDGSRIRGQRSTCTICDEFNTLDEQIFQEVIQGFSSVSLNPIEQVKEYYKYKALQELGQITQEELNLIDERRIYNQQISSGTCGYTFQPLYKLWKQYHDIITSRGDKQRINQIFGNDVPANINHKDFAIVRLPYELLPPKYMDEKVLARAKATIHSGIFSSEYGTCSLPDTKIITNTGIKKIKHIKIGDYVLTHKNRFKKVINSINYNYNGPITKYRSRGCYDKYSFTNNHLFWDNGVNWTNISIINSTYLASLLSLNNQHKLDIRLYTKNFIENDNKIYAKCAGNLLDNNMMQEIITSNLSKKEISIKYNIRLSNVYSIKKASLKKRKNLIPSIIDLDYKFGLIIGHYASEGNIGSNGRSVSFALDGHKEVPLKSYIKELYNAIYIVFGIKAKLYNRTSNCISITINNRLIADLIKYICPGVSHTKSIKPDILFSNKDFIKGFITGYWNGDGHVKEFSDCAIAGSASESLLYQVKLCLSNFGIFSGCYKRKDDIISYFNNKEYKTKPFYDLKIYGESLRLFKKIFYNFNKLDIIKNNKNKIICFEKLFKCPITYKESLNYNGLVYNLEVEEDNSYSTTNATVHNCFVSDSQGFFRRTLIEKCVVGKTPDNPIIKKCGEVNFTLLMDGHPNMRYVMGIDPAAESDNFAIIILELWGDHRRVVYTWTTNNANHKAKVKHGLVEEHDYYRYCARKIRDLMKIFRIDEIAMDAQGGGKAVSEVLGDPKYLETGEHPIYAIPDPKKPRDTDHLAGLHMLRLVEFSNAEWVYNANHGLRQDMETRELIFPSCDSLSFGMAHEQDKQYNRLKLTGDFEIDSLKETGEDVLFEIEELKNELVLIEHTKTPNGRDHWDTPKVKGLNAKKGRLRKDRYSALLMANMIGRSLIARTVEYKYDIFGGVAKEMSQRPNFKQISGEICIGDGFSGGFGVKGKRMV